MKFEEENHARNLHRALKAQASRGTNLHIHGRETEWSCAASRGHRSCSIACFHHSGETPGSEYLITFEQHNQGAAMGRTVATEEATSATLFWLDGHPVEILHKQFNFVDAQQRALAEIEKAIIASEPELDAETTHELRKVVRDIYYLWFVAKERSCRISYQGHNTQPDALFYGEETELFRCPVQSTDDLATVLKSWLCKGELPSQLHEKFPWIQMHPLAAYFEARYSTEGEFLTSWDNIEKFYRDEKFPLAAPVLAMIAEMRRVGYDHKLRAGHSLWSLVLSRSRRHGLRDGQPYIAFCFRPGATMEIYLPGRSNITLPEIKFTPEINTHLDQLAAHAIN